MGFWENAEKALNSLGNAMEKKQEEMVKKAQYNLRGKSVTELRNIVYHAELEGKWKLQELAQEELERRGEYY